jgi:hypothetical protein
MADVRNFWIFKYLNLSPPFLQYDGLRAIFKLFKLRFKSAIFKLLNLTLNMAAERYV